MQYSQAERVAHAVSFRLYAVQEQALIYSGEYQKVVAGLLGKRILDMRNVLE